MTFKHRGGERTHRGCGQGRLANQVGVRNGHAEAQPRARLLHGRDRRLEVAGERGGGGGRGRGRVGGLRRKQRGRKKERKGRKKTDEKESELREEVRRRQRRKTGILKREKRRRKVRVDYSSKQKLEQI